MHRITLFLYRNFINFLSLHILELHMTDPSGPVTQRKEAYNITNPVLASFLFYGMIQYDINTLDDNHTRRISL